MILQTKYKCFDIIYHFEARYAEIKFFNWSKLLMRLAAANRSDLFIDSRVLHPITFQLPT